MAAAADDDTANTSPNLPNNNNNIYSISRISLLEMLNIKNTPPLMASVKPGLPYTKKKSFGFDTDFGLKPNVFSSRVATDFHTLDQHTETSMKGGGGDRKRSASSSLHRTNPRPNHRPNQSSQHVISQLTSVSPLCTPCPLSASPLFVAAPSHAPFVPSCCFSCS